MADHTLDAKGLNCPLPILKARKALKEVPAGGTLEILATDPGSVADFEAFCRQTGNEIVELEKAPTGAGRNLDGAVLYGFFDHTSYMFAPDFVTVGTGGHQIRQNEQPAERPNHSGSMCVHHHGITTFFRTP